MSKLHRGALPKRHRRRPRRECRLLVGRPSDAENLSAAERAALHFAELFATNHLAIDDAVYDELREHFSEDELVELGLNCAIALGIGRLSATWDVSDDLPESSPPSGPLAPWNSASVVASG
jgi:alkylhydroperoxidase family enzyme